jgi:hypothetical protein
LISTSAMPFETRQRRELQASADALPLALNPETALQYAASLLSEAFVKANPDWLSQWQRELGTYDLHGMSNLINAVVTKGNQQEDVKQLSVPLWVADGIENLQCTFHGLRRRWPLPPAGAEAQICARLCGFCAVLPSGRQRRS